MNARFLRDEAARFRGMADETDREATKVRLLAMAADYDARAKLAHELTEPNSGEAVEAIPEPVPDESGQEPSPGGTLKLKSGRTETIVVQRRPVGRPKRDNV
jgi:hypothetical protein